MQSVDIHALIDQEFYASKKEASDTPTLSISPKVANPFRQLLASKYKTIMISNGEESDDKLLYFIRFSNKHFYLIQSKANRLRVSHFDFSKNFLSINKRKAILSDFQSFQSTLRKLTLAIVAQSPTAFYKPSQISNSVSYSDEEKNLLALLEKRCSFKSSAIQFFKSFKKSAYEKIGKYISTFSSLLLKKSSRSSKKSGALNLSAFQQIIQELMGDAYEAVMISNYQENSQNGAYCLELSKDGFTLTEKNQLHKQVITVDLKKNSVLINEKESSEKNFQWIQNKLRAIGNDLSKEKAQMFYS